MREYLLRKKEKEERVIWASVRATQEAFRFKYKRSGKKSRSNWSLFELLLWFYRLLLRLTRCYKRGHANAKNIELRRVKLPFENLPRAFNGFKILHLSDLHIDAIEGFEDILIEKIEPLDFDLCVITGDFRRDTTGSFRQILPAMTKLLAAIRPEQGVLAVLGNHDTFKMVEMLEPLGIRFLVNESVQIEKGSQHIRIIGTDDTYYFYTDMALRTLENDTEDFSIALSHTGEMSDIAAENHYKLYLCGHTHGGQICLPGGVPIITHQKGKRERVRGLWYQNGMKGYTSPGAGVSGIPLRYNCPPEITLFEMVREAPSPV